MKPKKHDIEMIKLFNYYITTIGEMYMFNRNQASQSISEFMKEKITEDDEDGNKESQESSETAAAATTTTTTTTATGATSIIKNTNDDSLTNDIKSLDVSKTPTIVTATTTEPPVKFKLDDDFLFQMDKGSLT